MHTELDGVVVLDKPADLTSARAVAEVKKAFEAQKCGHAGTLDPFATGVLVCCVNRATRLARFFLNGPKTYEALLRLGASTDTQDFTGQIIASGSVPDMDQEELNSVFKRFEGPQMQRPPVYAALKHKGTPLYKLARQGRPVQKAARPVTIEALRVMQIRLPDILFQVTCSAGTYVRALCADIGDSLGCGGHLQQLRRVAGSGFALAEAITLEALKLKSASDAPCRALIPMAEALRGMPAVLADNRVIEHIDQGRRIDGDMLAGTVAENSRQLPDQGYIKVIDRRRLLKAVLHKKPDSGMYDYCCVFH